MTKDQTFATDLAHFCHHQHWDLNRVTTATALVVNLEQNSYTGILWDLAATNLDTTIATMTLIRHQQNGPLLVFSPNLDDRQRRKLFRAKVDDVLEKDLAHDVLRPLIEQRCWLYQHATVADEDATTNDDDDEPIIEDRIKIGDWEIDPKKVQVTKAGQEVSLTRKEFQLLAFLADHQGQVLSREQLLNGVWGYDILGSSRIVDIHVSHLRDKLEDDSQKPVHLTTVRGFGYKLE
ncbi:winged helix family transcriptional regulator [Limosilactobacillus fermentum]|uniref:winged helix-turn-helix transcriptional regulator n=1 Tax=Limosilactobacillus fermentum TaxID=1613 RepID=UPI000F4D5510|nr:winged helix-turn-helix domain-containing protein [Limosilactobacillus fermentum]MCT2874497.1 winged helix family transcriptional regulator [Limosilactobacillus fermentum]